MDLNLKNVVPTFFKLIFVLQSVSILSNFEDPHFIAASLYMFYVFLGNETSTKWLRGKNKSTKETKKATDLQIRCRRRNAFQYASL